MNRRAVATIVWKDLLVVRRSRAMMIPLILVPLLILVVLPGLAALSPRLLPERELAELLVLLENAPPTLLRELAGLPPEQQVVILLLGYLFAPLYLLVPVMVASVIAADSFAGAVFLGPALLFGLGAAVWVIALVVIAAGARSFRRSEILARV